MKDSWESIKIGDEINLLGGFPFSSSKFNEESVGVPLIRIRDLLKSTQETYFSGIYSDSYLVEKGEILIGMDGDFHLVKWNNSPSLLNQRILKVSGKKNSKIDIDFLFYYLKPFLIDIHNKTAATTVKHLSTYDISEAVKEFPPLPQQRKIAQILSTVDAVLEKTEAAIAKYQQLKQGLMHDVFTRGIDVHTGQLRPKQTQAPELYKQSALGWIPKEWEVETVDSVAFLRHGYQFRDYDFVKEGIDVVKIGQIGKKGNVNLENSSKIASSRLDEFNSIQLFEGDILMALTGATLGKTAIIRGVDKPMLQNYRVGYFTPRDENKLNKLFLYYLLIGDSVQNEILGFVNTGAQGNIGKADFEKIKVIVPNSIQEQKLSSLKLQSIDQKIHTEQQALAKYQQLKAGLLQDLLTGKVEVRV